MPVASVDSPECLDYRRVAGYLGSTACLSIGQNPCSQQGYRPGRRRTASSEAESRAGHAALAASSLPQAIENFCRTDPAFELQE